MPKATYPRDRFDDLPQGSVRVGAHRAGGPRRRRGWVLLWAAVAVVVLVAIGIVSTLALSGRPSPQAPPVATGTPTPTVTPVLDTSYSVLVLNATSTAGLATSMKDRLVHAGWQSQLVTAGDASSSYPTTTVYYARAGDQAAAEGLARLVGARHLAVSDRYLPSGDPGAKQLTVVLGTDLVASPSPTTVR